MLTTTIIIIMTLQGNSVPLDTLLLTLCIDLFFPVFYTIIYVFTLSYRMNLANNTLKVLTKAKDENNK